MGSASRLTVEIDHEIMVSGPVRFIGEGRLDVPAEPVSSGQLEPRSRNGR